MSRKLATLATVLALWFSSCATPLESIYAPCDMTGWKVGHASDAPGKGTLVEYVPENETVDSWNKMSSVQFLENEHRPLPELVRELESKMRQRCPDRTEWRVLEEDSASVTYEWSIHDCSPHPDQCEIARLMRGNDGTHRIAYTEKGAAFDPDARTKWLAIFRNARVVKGESMEPVVLAQ
jgi:hypothetical protein